jgi:hypothetical protein
LGVLQHPGFELWCEIAPGFGGLHLGQLLGHEVLARSHQRLGTHRTHVSTSQRAIR